MIKRSSTSAATCSWPDAGRREPLADRRPANAVVEPIRRRRWRSIIVNLQACAAGQATFRISQSLARHARGPGALPSEGARRAVRRALPTITATSGQGRTRREHRHFEARRHQAAADMVPEQFAASNCDANFIGSSDHRGYPVIDAVFELEALCRQTTPAPLIAFVHRGEEYRNTGPYSNIGRLDELHRCSRRRDHRSAQPYGQLNIEGPRGAPIK